MVHLSRLDAFFCKDRPSLQLQGTPQGMRLGHSSDGSPGFLKEGNTECMGSTSRAEHLTSLMAMFNSQEAIWHSTCINVNALPPESDGFLNCTFLLFDKVIKKWSMLPLLDLNLFPSWNLKKKLKAEQTRKFYLPRKPDAWESCKTGQSCSCGAFPSSQGFPLLPFSLSTGRQCSRSIAERPSAPRSPAWAAS